MFAGLSLDQAPPFKAVLKFFLSAPIFAVLAGVFAFFSDDLNMYSFKTIASVHFITIGFMVMVIFGALQQMLPVVAGAVIKKPILIANITYFGLIIGLFSFSFGFFFYEKILLFNSAIFLLTAGVLFLGVCLFELLKVKPKSIIVQGIIISLIFALIAIFFGIHLEISHARESISQSHLLFSNLHYNLVFFGFLFLLIVAITFQVAPMFWVTNPFHKNKQKFIIYSLTTILIIFSTFGFYKFEYNILYKFSLFFITIYFAYETIKSITSRKRKLKDLSIYYYISSMLFLCFGSFYYLMLSFFELKIEILGVLWGLGFIISLMNGMLYKIVPFLAWFHLSSKGFFDIPTIRDMIPLKHIEKQYYLHLASIISLVLYYIFDNLIFSKIGTIVFIVSNIYLFFNLYKAAKVYLNFDMPK